MRALCTSEKAIVAWFVAAFKRAWDTAELFGTDALALIGDGVPAAERELLRLLARGLTDEAVGHKLGISACTVRRQVEVLMERLDASSRFEAGLKVAQQGSLLSSAPGDRPEEG